MKTTLFVPIMAIFGLALPADALDVKAITAKPTADNPQYASKKAWPMLVGDEYFPKPKNHKKKAKQPTGAKRYYGYEGYNARIQGDLIGYPAKGTDARLVVYWQRISFGGAGNWGRGDETFVGKKRRRGENEVLF